MPFPTSASFKSVIRGTSSLYNYFTGVQGEPGHGQYYAFDAGSEMNTVLGHDNFPNGPESHDAKFVYLNAGSLSASVELSSSTVTASKLVCSDTKRDVCGSKISETASVSAAKKEPNEDAEDVVSNLQNEVSRLKRQVARMERVLQELDASKQYM